MTKAAPWVVDDHWVIRRGGIKWEYTALRNWEDEAQCFTSLRRNGVEVYRAKYGDGFQYAGAQFTGLETGYPVLVQTYQTGMSHGVTRQFYRVGKRGLKPILSIYGFGGGPMLRDIDRDGTPEWIFTNSADHPMPYSFEVYQETPSGILKKIHTWKNPKKTGLPWIGKVF